MIATGSSRPWIQTRMGHRFYFDDPREGVIVIRDIAAALSKICRFGGHCSDFYSVAEHSVHVSKVLESRYPDGSKLAMAGLLHDAAEAYLGDMTTPLKSCSDMQTFREREAMTLNSIEKQFRLHRGLTHDERVKAADRDCLAVEARELCSPLDPGWEIWLAGVTPVDITIQHLIPGPAEVLFLNRYRELRG